MNDCLKLDNQICFMLYRLSKFVINQYRPHLEPLGLTYPQYLVMLVLWEHQAMSVSGIGKLLQLDSGTLTPLLKRLESKSLITRTRSPSDERTVIISLTDDGKDLEVQAIDIPAKLSQCLNVGTDDLRTLKAIADKLTHTHP